MGLRAGIVMMGLLGLLPIGGTILWAVALAVLVLLALALVIAEVRNPRSTA
jgi:hypothetical protein